MRESQKDPSGRKPAQPFPVQTHVPYGHRTPLLHDCFGPPPSRLLLAREKIDSLDVQIAGHLGLRGGVAKAVEALGDARIT